MLRNISRPAIFLGPVGDRLRGSPALQRIVERVHSAGPRPVGELLVELLEHANADPAILDKLHKWGRLDPEVVRALGGRNFPRPPPRVVPPERKR